jgi:3-dehydroquinate synthase
MVAAAHIAAEIGKLDDRSAARVQETVLGLGPLPPVIAPAAEVLRLLQSDKKTRNGIVHFVLPTRIGATEIVKDVPHRAVINAVDAIRRVSRI